MPDRRIPHRRSGRRALMPRYGPLKGGHRLRGPQIGHDPVPVAEGHLRSRGPMWPVAKSGKPEAPQ